MITSTQNSLIMNAVKLKDKRQRKAESKYILEGEKMVFEALAIGKRFEVIFSTKEHDWLPGSNVVLVSESVFKKLSDTINPQGVLGVLEIPHYEMPLFSRCVVLDNIQDAGNLGAIIRTMAAVGIEVLLLNNCVDVYNSKTIRSSMSGVHYIKAFSLETKDIISLLKERNIPLVVADMSGRDAFSISLDTFALVIGNEAHGVSESFKLAMDIAISLKMQNVESLNAAIAASILLYKFTN